MSKRNSDHPFLFGVLILLFSGSLGYLAWAELADKIPHRVSNYYEASKYAVSAQNRIDRTCGGIEAAGFTECSIQVEQSERANHRAQKDLRAQRYMAIWASIMAIAAVATVGVSGLGLWWIKRTFDQTRLAVQAADDAVSVTREIGQAQVRAYLTFDITKVDFREPNLAPDNKDDPKPNLLVELVGKVKNSGQSPAKNISFIYMIEDSDKDQTVYEVGEFHRVDPIAHSIASGGEFENQSLKRVFTAPLIKLQNERSHICFCIIVEWDDVFGETIQSEPVFGTVLWFADENGDRTVYYGRRNDKGQE